MARRLPRMVYLAFGELAVNPVFSRVHRWLLRRNRGRVAIRRLLGLDAILVTTKGRKTGEPRTVPLGAVRDGARWLVIASNAGHDRPPAWAMNMSADPDVSVDAGSGPTRCRAHAAIGDEADHLWPLVISVYPGYADYQARTERPILLFVLEPVMDA